MPAMTSVPKPRRDPHRPTDTTRHRLRAVRRNRATAFAPSRWWFPVGTIKEHQREEGERRERNQPFAKRQCAIRNERDRPNQDADNNERPPLPNGHRSPRRSGPKFLFQFGYETSRFQNLEHIRRESAARHHV